MDFSSSSFSVSELAFSPGSILEWSGSSVSVLRSVEIWDEGWDGMDMNMNMNMNVDMFLNKTCCRYLFSCGKKIRKNEIQLTLAAAFTLYINVCFLFLLLLLHKT